MSTDDATLATIEARVRDSVRTRLNAIGRAYTTAVRAAQRAEPGATGTEVTSRPAVHAALSTALAGARSAVEAQIRAGWRAGARAAGHEPDTGYLDNVLGDVRAAFDTAALDLPSSVATAHDGVAGSRAGQVRPIVIGVAVDRAVRRLGVRAAAAAAVAVHRGYTDAQLAAAGTDPAYLGRRKRWQVTSANPCGACAALHGAAVAVDAEFDHTATTDTARPAPRVYRNLLGPPRHPNCRCRIVIDDTEATTALREQVAQAVPGTARHLSAADIRRMPAREYDAVVGHLDTATARIRALLGQVRDGQ